MLVQITMRIHFVDFPTLGSVIWANYQFLAGYENKRIKDQRALLPGRARGAGVEVSWPGVDPLRPDKYVCM